MTCPARLFGRLCGGECQCTVCGIGRMASRYERARRAANRALGVAVLWSSFTFLLAFMLIATEADQKHKDLIAQEASVQWK